MALQRQNIPVPFTRGLNRTEDVRLESRIVDMVDLEFDTTSTPITRPGLRRQALPATSGNVVHMFEHRRTQHWLDDNGQVFSASGKVSSGPDAPRYTLRSEPVFALPPSVEQWSTAQATDATGNIAVAWVDTANNIHVRVQGPNGTFIREEALTSVSGTDFATSPHLVYSNGDFFLFYVYATPSTFFGNVKVAQFSATGTGVATTTSVALPAMVGSVSTTLRFFGSTAVSHGGVDYVGIAGHWYPDGSGNRHTYGDVIRLDTLANLGGFSTTDTKRMPEIGNVVLKYSAGAMHIYVGGVRNGAGTYFAATSRVASASWPSTSDGAYFIFDDPDNSSNVLLVLYEELGTGYGAAPEGYATLNATTQAADFTGASTVGEFSVGKVTSLRLLVVNGRPAFFGFTSNGGAYALDIRRSAEGGAPSMLASISYANAPSPHGLATVDGGWTQEVWAVDYLTAGQNNYSSRMVTAFYLEEGQANSVEVNNGRLLAGACPRWFDGKNLVEDGFLNVPDIMATADTNAASSWGMFSAGVISVCATYAWVDAVGNWHESAPTDPVTVTFDASNKYLQMYCSLPTTNKSGIRVLYYRTGINSADATFYLFAGDGVGVTVTSDDDLTAGQPLPTTGGVLAPQVCPPCRHLALHQSRVIVTGLPETRLLSVSKKVYTGYGLEFIQTDSAFNQYVAGMGRLVGSAPVSGKLLLLGDQRLGILYGEAADDSGLGGFAPAEVILEDLGVQWNSPEAIALSEGGVWFWSSRGVPRFFSSNGIARDERGKLLGSGVPFSSDAHVTTVSGGTKKQVRFYSASDCYVWFPEVAQWSRYTNHGSVAAAVVADVDYLSSGACNFYTGTRAHDEDATGSVVDPSPSIELTLNMAGIAGLQRVWEFQILAEDVDSVWTQVGGISGETLLWDVDLTANDFDNPQVSTGQASLAFVMPYSNVRYQPRFQQFSQATLRLELSVTGMYGFYQAFLDMGDQPARVRLTGLALLVGMISRGYKPTGGNV